MPTLKDVVYKIIKEKNEALASYYYEFQTEDTSKRGYHLKDVFDNEYVFWYNEIIILPLDDAVKTNLLYDLHEAVSRGDYLKTFEDDVLPILLRYWKFNQD